MATATRSSVRTKSHQDFVRVIQSVLGYTTTSFVWLALQEAEIDDFINFVGMMTSDLKDLEYPVTTKDAMGATITTMCPLSKKRIRVLTQLLWYYQYQSGLRADKIVDWDELTAVTWLDFQQTTVPLIARKGVEDVLKSATSLPTAGGDLNNIH